MLVLLALGASACDDGADRRGSTATPEARKATPTAQPAPAVRPAAGAVAWTHDTVLQRLRGRRIRIGERTVNVDSATIACAGVDRAARAPRRGERAWTRFRCVQPTFPRGRVAGPDAIFFVEPTGRRSYVVTDRRFSSY